MDHPVVPDSPLNTLVLSKDVISGCITKASSLNLSAEKEIIVSYIYGKKPITAHGGRKLLLPNATVTPHKGSSSQPEHIVQHADKPLETAAGSCSILIKAPPGKVLSILFLKQTCSRDNQVRVQDIHDGWSTTLDGCMPWKSPGYDVTTANRSAVMVMDLHNADSFFRLKVQIKSIAMQVTNRPIIRKLCRPNGVILRSFSHDLDGPQTVSRLISESPYRLGQLLPNDTSEFRAMFYQVYGNFFHGIRLLFSFHEVFLTPQRHPVGLWNCSVPTWPDFQQHFVCNNQTDCAGREDEMGCPDISCQRGGTMLNENCYFFHYLPLWESTWHHANTACKQRGAALATFPTGNSWYHLATLIRGKEMEYIYIGLYSPDASYPHRYRYLLQWQGGSVGHYVDHNFYFSPPTCTYLFLNTPFHVSCADIQLFTACALCQTSPSRGTEVSQKGLGKISTSQRPVSQLRNTSQQLFPVASISCPDDHRIHDFLACDAFSACWRDHNVCMDVDGVSFTTLFSCQSGAGSFPYSVVCNHLQDCADNSDEGFCVFPPCSAASQYKCANGQCLHIRYYCDEFVQCVDESDETDCVANGVNNGTGGMLSRPPAVADFDGRGFMVYTPLTTGWMEKSAVVCPDTHMFCPGDGYCLPVYVRCNGLYDCISREDENGCDSYTCPGLYRCRGLLAICLHPNHLCDDWPQCPQHDDELFCNMTCSVNCTCLGHAFTCSGDFDVESVSRLRYLDAGGTGLKPERLANNTMLVYLGLARCDLTHLGKITLPNLLSLDVRDNRLSVVTFADLNLFKKLQNLYLARNPLSKFFSRNFSSVDLDHAGIHHVDLTGVNINVLDVDSYLPFPSLLSLNLSESGVTRLIGDGFRSVSNLRTLDLRGCQITEFPKRLFKGLKELRLVFTDNYKLCCEANLPDSFNINNCQAPFDEVSSCDALLRADVYRICLSVLAALALSGNLGCFCLRIFSLTGRGKTSFNVFVTHLCVSDFVMGVYMAMIGVADRLYLGRYLWEDARWRHSAACQVAGVLALLSSEVSAFIVCLITLDRFLVIRFPFSRLRFSSFSAQVASLLTWTVGVVLVTVPFLPVTTYTHFYGQTGICVPLPITRTDFAGHHYAFGVMILLNLVVFLVIAAGQISVYQSMMSNAMSSIDTTKKSRDLIVARRLISVVVSDFLCWFPLGLLGVLAAQGVPVPGEVNVAMAIFVLPLNSALNPFLYTLNMIQEKRQRATEVKLLKFIVDEIVKE